MGTITLRSTLTLYFGAGIGNLHFDPPGKRVTKKPKNKILHRLILMKYFRIYLPPKFSMSEFNASKRSHLIHEASKCSLYKEDSFFQRSPL